MYRTDFSRLFTTIAIAVALAILSVGCGSDTGSEGESAAVADESAEGDAEQSDQTPGTAEPTDETSGTEQTDETSEAGEETGETSETGEQSDETFAGPVEIIELEEPELDGLEAWSLPAMGGITFWTAPDDVVIHDGDMVLVRAPFDPDRGRLQPAMIVAFAHTDGNRNPQTLTVESLTTTVIEGLGMAQPSGRALEWLDRSLDGWRFTLAGGLPPAPHYVVSAFGSGFDGISAWQPFPHAELFLTDTPNGVLVIGWIAETEEELADARGIFDRVAPTIALANSPDTPIAPAELADFGTPQEPPAPASPADRPDDWPASLSGLSKPLDTGPYSSNYMVTPFRFDVGAGWWVQNNFPGWMALTADDSFGPSDRGIEIYTGADELWGVTRAGTVGDPVPVSELFALSEGALGSLNVLESETIEAGIAEGVRLRVEVDPAATCTADEPCAFWLTNTYPYPPASLRKGYVYDLWYYDEGMDASVLFVVGTPDAAWFDISDAVMESVEFIPAA